MTITFDYNWVGQCLSTQALGSSLKRDWGTKTQLSGIGIGEVRGRSNSHQDWLELDSTKVGPIQ